MITDRIAEFLAQKQPQSPCLIVDTEVVKNNYLGFVNALPFSRVFYAVKANPAPEILRLLVSLGSCFDTASVEEIQMAFKAGAQPHQVSFGNTIKKEKDIALAYQLGVDLFAVDSFEEVEKIARVARGSKVFCRLLTDGAGAEWPLSRKFGCSSAMAVDVLCFAKKLGLQPIGVSFHVGSQQTHLAAWDHAIKAAAELFSALAKHDIKLKMVNMGGGFPTQYIKKIPDLDAHSQVIKQALIRYFGNALPETIIEPGRAMVGNAGVISTEVVLIARKDRTDDKRWVYLDVGRFNGLPETLDEAIRYKIVSERDGEQLAPCILAGPTCDSADVIYEKTPYLLPVSLQVGDRLLVLATGAYTSTYASVAFNGFEPIKTFVI